jgi:serine protease
MIPADVHVLSNGLPLTARRPSSLDHSVYIYARNTITMRYILSLLTLALCSFCSLAQKPEIVPGQLIVQVGEGRSIEHVVLANQLLAAQPTALRMSGILSPIMRTYLLDFDPAIDHNAMLQQVFAHPAVTAVQFNHIVKDRSTIPNDPQFGQQWHHVNGNDADVDSDLAWDITTGGLTALGDTIVVCIVDDGTKRNHPDLAANNWVNHNEIPGNGIDDDGNGYVDDYFGWNPVSNNDNVDNGSHGVQVSGMVGAKGNNATGVVGVNWDVKLMSVTYGNIGSGSNPNEANVIAAYNYPLTMRKLYHESNGALGAFVVATNSSWGIDNGNPANAPIWCAFYDTLGVYGILSAGATANAQINVDVNGDLPTGCSSDYLISVTATNNNDVRTFSAYGATTIDLAAPGESVRTTSGTNGYGNVDGTSFASPMVAGAIALLYSAPCPSLASIAHADPALAAEMVKQYILDGVDGIPGLVGFTLTGGRLNLRGALDQLIQNCSGAGCIGPLNVNVASLSGSAATVSWSSVPDILSFDIRYGVVGGEDTTTVDGVTSPYGLTGLLPCTQYWVSLRSNCEEDSSAWTADRLFATDGCCVPPAALNVTGVQTDAATASWNSVLAAQSYTLQWRPATGGNWVSQTVTSPSFIITGLDACTTYEVRIATVCDTGSTDFIYGPTFITKGCGACTDLVYCASSGVVSFEWIANVSIGGFTNTTGANGGYGDFTDLPAIDLHAGETYPVSFTPGFANSSFREHFRLWIDLNRNGVFSMNNELLFDDTQGSTSTVTGTITIPANAQLGSARIRVSMAYGSQFGGDYPQTSCDSGQDGEVEDYCVNILEALPIDTTGIREYNGQIFGLEVFPVPSSDVLHVRILDGQTTPTAITVIDVQGRTILRQSVTNAPLQRIEVSALPKGVYLIELYGKDGITGRARFVRN